MKDINHSLDVLFSSKCRIGVPNGTTHSRDESNYYHSLEHKIIIHKKNTLYDLRDTWNKFYEKVNKINVQLNKVKKFKDVVFSTLSVYIDTILLIVKKISSGISFWIKNDLEKSTKLSFIEYLNDLYLYLEPITSNLSDIIVILITSKYNLKKDSENILKIKWKGIVSLMEKSKRYFWKKYKNIFLTFSQSVTYSFLIYYLRNPGFSNLIRKIYGSFSESSSCIQNIINSNNFTPFIWGFPKKLLLGVAYTLDVKANAYDGAKYLLNKAKNINVPLIGTLTLTPSTLISENTWDAIENCLDHYNIRDDLYDGIETDLKTIEEDVKTLNRSQRDVTGILNKFPELSGDISRWVLFFNVASGEILMNLFSNMLTSNIKEFKELEDINSGLGDEFIIASPFWVLFCISAIVKILSTSWNYVQYYSCYHKECEKSKGFCSGNCWKHGIQGIFSFFIPENILRNIESKLAEEGLYDISKPILHAYFALNNGELDEVFSQKADTSEFVDQYERDIKKLEGTVKQINDSQLELIEEKGFKRSIFINIKIQNFSGKIINFKIKRNNTILHLKNKIKDALGILTSDNILEFDGNTLENNFIINDYNIEHGSTIQLKNIYITIFVRTLISPNIIPIAIKSGDITVGLFKQRIEDILGIPPYQMRLFFNKTRLQDDGQTIKSYNLQDGSMIYIVVRQSN
jgi:hypothetical protein